MLNDAVLCLNVIRICVLVFERFMAVGTGHRVVVSIKMSLRVKLNVRKIYIFFKYKGAVRVKMISCLIFMVKLKSGF